VSRSHKPFAQYSGVLPDGRSAVEATIFDPFIVRVVLVAADKREALQRIRALGGRDVHVSKSFRPAHRVVDRLVDDGLDGVFAPDPQDGTWLPLSELPAFLAGTSRFLARYDTSAFNRSFVGIHGDPAQEGDAPRGGTGD